MTKPVASLITTTYNKPRQLELLLTALSQQSRLDFEVVIGDDGSGPETRQFIERFARQAPWVATKHHWQEDEGFRAGQARNGAIALAESDYLIFIDGDILAHPEFVAGHLAARRRRCVLYGSRLKLNERFSDSLTPEALRSEGIVRLIRRNYFTCRSLSYDPSMSGFKDTFSGYITQLVSGFYIPSKRWNRLMARWDHWPEENPITQLFRSGSNFSCPMEDIVRVNGFDERFGDGSGEDGELFWRLYNAGCDHRSVRWTAVAYHLHHTDNWQRKGPARAAALAIERETRERKLIRCEKGLSEHRSE